MKIPWRGQLLIGVVAIYFAFLWPAALRMAPEGDLWWVFPGMKYCLLEKSSWEGLFFMFTPTPLGLGQPTLKIFLHAVPNLLGPEIWWFVLISMVVQVGNAALLGLLARQWGMSLRTSAVVAVVFLTFFGHFHAVLWPTAFQHLAALTNILVLLNLYFWTESRLQGGKGAAAGFAGVILATLTASMQRSVLIAIVVIAADMVVSSKNSEEWARRFRRWWWVFLLYALYPILMLTWVGEPTLTEGLRKLSIPEGLRALLVTDPLFPNPIHWVIRTAILSGLVLAALWAGMAALYLTPRRWLDRSSGYLCAVAGAGVLLLWCLEDHRQLLFLYNGFVPFLASFSILLDPLRTAFKMSTIEAFYFLSPQVSAGTVLLALAAIAVFWKTQVLRSGKPGLLIAWYLVTLGVSIHQNSSLPAQTPSRYFIYLSPVVAMVAVCGLESLLTLVFRAKRSDRAREVALYGIVAVLCVSNLAAVRVALFRGRLTNTPFFYDDLRTVRIIRDEALETGDVRVIGVVPMPIHDVWRDFPLPVPPDYDNLEIAARVLGAGPMRAARGAAEEPGSRSPLYRLDGTRVVPPLGSYTVEPFYQRVREGRLWLSKNEIERANRAFKEAVTRPPFLLTYLTEGARISDLPRVTGGLPLTDWLNQLLEEQWDPGQPESPKIARFRVLLREETRSYLQALVLLALTEQMRGRPDECRYWLSQTQLLEGDPKAVVHSMNMLSADSSNKELEAFLRKIEDPTFFMESVNQKKEDYAIGRFMLRLILGLDIRSSWDRRFFEDPVAEPVIP